LIGADGIEALAVYLIDHPDVGDINTSFVNIVRAVSCYAPYRRLRGGKDTRTTKPFTEYVLRSTFNQAAASLPNTFSFGM